MDEAQETAIEWEELLEKLAPLDFALLEQLYVVEQAPVLLRVAQDRLSYLNMHRITVSRHAEALAKKGLLSVVVSCEVSLNPYPRIQRNVERLVALWRAREARSRQRDEDAWESDQDFDVPIEASDHTCTTSMSSEGGDL